MSPLGLKICERLAARDDATFVRDYADREGISSGEELELRPAAERAEEA